MFRILALSKRKDGLSPEQFRTHYETRHVPLVTELAPPPGEYNRRYINFSDPLNVNAGDAGFDVAVEMTFDDRTAFEAWIQKLTGPDTEGRVQADQNSFMDMSAFRVCVITER